MKFRDKARGISELKQEMNSVAELAGSNREDTRQLQIRNSDLNRRESEQVAIWEAHARDFHEHESEYTTLLRAVRLAKADFVDILTKRVDQITELRQLRSELSKRDLPGMLSFQEKQRAFFEMEVRELPRLQASLDQSEEAVEKLEKFLLGLVNEYDQDR
jgi:hypothetical protein